MLRRGVNLPRPSFSARSLSAKLFVGGLCYDSNETVLRDGFAKFGDIIEVKVICDHRNGKSKGYGFVRFAQESSAIAALKEMNGELVDGRNIRVHLANSQN